MSMVKFAGRLPLNRIRLKLSPLMDTCMSLPDNPVNSINGTVGICVRVLIVTRLLDDVCVRSESKNLWLYADVNSSSKLVNPLTVLGISYGPLTSPIKYQFKPSISSFAGPSLYNKLFNRSFSSCLSMPFLNAKIGKEKENGTRVARLLRL